MADALSSFVNALSLPPLGVLIAILIIYIILGCIMSVVTITVVTLPIFLPLLNSLGFNLVWFGVLFVIMSELALITPPIGVNVFVVSGMAPDVPMSAVFRGIAPFIIPMLLVVVILIIYPQLALFLPNVMIGGG
jgi:TRAP-type C4-dicarboxylate transport system permease large subunit